MRAGSLRHRVEIQALVKQKGSTGAPVEVWQRVAVVWADVRGVSGRTFLAASAEQSEVTTEIFMRYRADVFARMRVLHKQVVFEVVAPLPDPRRTQLRLMCKSLSGGS